MNIRQLVVAIAFLGIFMISGRALVDTDTWWHLRAGQWIMENQSVPDADHFSYTREGKTWHYPGWLTEVYMYSIYQLGGLPGLDLSFTFIILLTFGVVFLTMQGDSFLRAFTILLAATSAAIYMNARPQILTFFFSAVFYLCIREYLFGHRNWLWILPILMVFWVNIHGGFAMGLILLLIAIAGQGLTYLLLSKTEHSPEQAKKTFILCGIGIASLAATVINPYGIEMLFYPFRTVSIQVLQNYIVEWQSPNFHFLNAQPFLWLFLLTWMVLVFSPKRAAIPDMLYLLVIGYMGFLAWRNTILLSVIAPAIIATYGQPILEKYLPAWKPTQSTFHGNRAFHSLLFVVLSIAAVLFVGSSKTPESIQRQIRSEIPVDAVAYLADHPGLGRLINSYNWGAYLIWNLPTYPVFVDGRTDVFDDEILNQYLTATRAQEGWSNVLQRWNIRVALLETTSPLSELLRSEGWLILYQDSQAIILRRPDGHADLP